MATVTKSIGTSSRDYSTITAWEADLDDTNIYTSGDDAVGECYNDSVFDEDISLDGGHTVGLTSITLTVAATERHDGTAGSGARIVYSGTSTGYIVNLGLGGNARPFKLFWLEVDNNANTNPYFCIDQVGASVEIANCIVHGINKSSSSSVGGIWFDGSSSGSESVRNNLIYDCQKTGSTTGGSAMGILLQGNSYNYQVLNNTVYNIASTHDSYGIYMFRDNHVSKVVKNCIAIDTSAGSIVYDFYPSTITTNSVEYNLSSDSTAFGTGSLTGKTAANQFVSTVSGSEDLHLKTGADAIAAGVDLGSSPVGVQYDIDGVDRDARGLAWDIGADQAVATVVKTIGTSSRDYSTIIAWEAALDDPIYQTGDDAVGECYNDSTFTQTDNLIIRSGGVVGLNSVTLTAATTDRHDGTAGTGAEIGVANLKRIYMQAGYNASVSIKNVVSWLDINGQGYGRTGLFASYTVNDELKNCICRSVGDQVLPPRNCYNNIIYTGGSFIYNANYGTVYAADVLNNTVYGVNRGITVGIANSNVSIKNNICAGTSIVDFDGNFGNIGYGVPQVSNNLSSDATAPGTNSLINKSVAKQFVSTLSGSEDLHLKFISAAIDAGVDLGTTPDGVQYDINGKDRDAENSIWDIGAHEFGDNVVYGLFTVL